MSCVRPWGLILWFMSATNEEFWWIISEVAISREVVSTDGYQNYIDKRERGYLSSMTFRHWSQSSWTILILTANFPSTRLPILTPTFIILHRRAGTLEPNPTISWNDDKYMQHEWMFDNREGRGSHMKFRCVEKSFSQNLTKLTTLKYQSVERAQCPALSCSTAALEEFPLFHYNDHQHYHHRLRSLSLNKRHSQGILGPSTGR